MVFIGKLKKKYENYENKKIAKTAKKYGSQIELESRKARLRKLKSERDKLKSSYKKKSGTGTSIKKFIGSVSKPQKSASKEPNMFADFGGMDKKKGKSEDMFKDFKM